VDPEDVDGSPSETSVFINQHGIILLENCISINAPENFSLANHITKPKFSTILLCFHCGNKNELIFENNTAFQVLHEEINL
jgi:hypothetical protein